MADLGGFLPPVVAELRGDISDFKAKMGEARTEITATESHGTSGFNKLATVGKAAFLGLGAIAVAAAVIGVKAADEWEGAHARLETAIKNSGGTFEEYKGRIDSLESKSEKLGWSNTQVESSLSTLVSATHNTKTAVNDMALAEDIARGRKMDLSAATALLAKVETGHVSLLGRLGINTKDATGATISQTEALRLLSQMYGGQASAYADTFGGKMQALKAEGEDYAKSLGVFLIPKIMAVGGATADTVGWLTQHRTAAILLAAAIGGPLVLAMGAYVVKEAEELGVSIASKWTSMIGLAKTVGYEAHFAALQLGEMSIAEIAVASGATLGIAALAALVVMNWSTSSQTDKATDAGNKWVNTQLKTANAAGTSASKMVILKDSLATAEAGLHSHEQAVDRLSKTYHDWHDVQTAGARQLHEEHLAMTESQTKVNGLKEAIAKLRDEQNHNTEAAKRATVAAQAQATVLGITLPAGVKQSASEMKALTKDMPVAISMFGLIATQAAISSGLTGSALDAIIKHAQALDTAIANSATSVIGSFISMSTDGAAVSEKDIEKTFFDSVTATARWATEMQSLISSGIDQGIVEQFAQAGPKSEPNLDAFLQMIQTKGVAWINDTDQFGQKAMASVQTSINGMVLVAGTPIPPAKVTADTTEFDEATKRVKRQIAEMNGMIANPKFAMGNQNGTYDPSVMDPTTGMPYGVDANGNPIARPHARGGIFDRAHYGVVAEKGREAVLPLTDPARSGRILGATGLLDDPRAMAAAGFDSRGAPPSSGGGGNTYGDTIVHVETDANPNQIAAAVGWTLRTR